MKFVITEDIWERLGTIGYRGVIGIFWDSTPAGMLAYLIFGLTIFFAIIGILAILKKLLFGRKKKMDPHEKWLKTGRMD